MTIMLVTGTGTEIGKTVVTAAVASLALGAGRRVAVLKPAQTGVAPEEPGDIDEVVRLAGELTTSELGRYPEPLAPATAAARSGLPPVSPEQIAKEAARLTLDHDLVLVEGAGGLLVRYDEQGSTLAEVPGALKALGHDCAVLLVTTAGRWLGGDIRVSSQRGVGSPALPASPIDSGRFSARATSSRARASSRSAATHERTK